MLNSILRAALNHKWDRIAHREVDWLDIICFDFAIFVFLTKHRLKSCPSYPVRHCVSIIGYYAATLAEYFVAALSNNAAFS
jgi:hypothetical protein